MKAVPFERMEMRPTSLPATSEAVIPSHPGLRIDSTMAVQARRSIHSATASHTFNSRRAL